PIELTLAQLAIKDGTAVWRDELFTPAVHVTAGKFDVKLSAASGGPPPLLATIEPGKPMALKVHGLSVSNGDIKARLAGTDEDWLQLARLGVSEVSVDLAGQDVVIAEASAQDGTLRLRRTRGGVIEVPTPLPTRETAVS